MASISAVADGIDTLVAQGNPWVEATLHWPAGTNELADSAPITTAMSRPISRHELRQVVPECIVDGAVVVEGEDIVTWLQKLTDELRVVVARSGRPT